MKRILFIAMAVVMLLSVLSVSALADSSFDTGDTVYSIPDAAGISFSYAGSTGVTLVPQGGATIESLIDGDAVADIAHFNEEGIVLVRNDYIKPAYEANNAKAEQSLDSIPTFSFAIEYDDEVTFDALYIAFMHEINDCIATPGNNQVVLEYSNDGDVWQYVDIFFYRPDLPEYTGKQDGTVEEHIVPIGKEISAKYVRVTFDFKLVPETTPSDFWTYYTNVYEWCGFTELGVAAYESGEEPRVMTQEESVAPDAEVEGIWVSKGEDLATVYKFEAGVFTELVYDVAEFEVSGMEAEAVSESVGEYNIYVNELTINYNDDEWIYVATIDENGALVLDDGFDQFTYETYVAPEKPDDSDDPVSDVTSSDDTSSDDTSSDSVSEPDDSEEPADSQSPFVSGGNKLPITADTSDNDDGMSTTTIIIIIVAAVVVIAAVVVVIVIRNKKK